MIGNVQRIVMAALVSACLTGGSGCSKSTSTNDNGASKPAKKMVIGVSIPSPDHGWTAGISYWANQAKAMHPEVEFRIKTAETPEKQSDDIQTMLSQNVDGLVVQAFDSGPITPVAKQAHAQGVFIVSVDRGLTESGIADVFLEGDNKGFGRKSAQFMADKLGGKGNIVILEGIAGTTVNKDRVSAAKEVFARYPEIHILGDQPADWSREKAQDAMQTFLTKNPHIDAVWAQDDDMALGVMKAMQEAGRDKDMWVLGGAGMKDIVKRVMDHDPMYPADITYPPSMIATGMHMAASALRDGRVKELAPILPRHLVLDVDVITPENAKDYYFKDSVY